MDVTQLKKFNREKRKSNIKYKSKNKKHESQSKLEPELESKPVEDLPNNWSRYEINEEDETIGANFESLLQEPVSSDSYFKFKFEHNWDAKITSELNLNKYFTLDLKLLNEGISTIPFHKRHNYDKSLFSSLELESIQKQADINSKEYAKYLSHKFPNKESKIIIKNNPEELKANNLKTVESATETTEREQNSIAIPKTNENKIASNTEIQFYDHVDDLLNLKFSQQLVIENESEIKVEDPLVEQTEDKKIVTPQSVDLEQWLDDILDE